MGLFGKKRFVSDTEYRKNLSKQKAMSPMVLDQLRQLGVSETAQLKLEFFFYTDKEPKAAALAGDLAQMGYGVEHRRAAGLRKQLVINGWTTKMRMDVATVVTWTEQMCELGYRHDCDFDGWGTTPDQTEQ